MGKGDTFTVRVHASAYGFIDDERAEEVLLELGLDRKRSSGHKTPDALPTGGSEAAGSAMV